MDFKLILFAAFFIPNCIALYEDQVGKFDWKQSYVGRIKQSHIDFKSKVKRVFVITESNAVAALNLKSGEILWRQVLETDEIGRINALFVGNEVVTVSGSDSYMIRGWNPNTGVLVYEWLIQLGPGYENVHWVLGNNKVSMIRFMELAMEISSYHLKTGASAGSKTITASWLTSKSICETGDSWIACVSEKGILTTFEYGALAPKVNSLGRAPVSVKQVPSPHPSLRLEYSDGSTQLTVVTPDGLIKADVSPDASIAVHTFNNHHIAITLTQKDGVYNVNGFVVETMEPVKEVGGKAQHMFPLQAATISSLYCVEDRISCYLLAAGEDSAISLVNSGRVLWLREEALANIVSVEMIGLPVSDIEAAIEKEFNNNEAGIVGMFSRRVLSQLSQLQTNLGLGDEGSDSRNMLVRDTFGLHKLIVVVTSVSKVYGIDNENGEIVWQYQVEGVEPYFIQDKPNVPFYVQRTARHFPYPALCTLLFKSKKNQNTVLFVFNPINGHPLEGGAIDMGTKVRQALLLPRNNHEFIKGLVLLTVEDTVIVFPPTAKQEALSIAKNLYMFTADPLTSEVVGYTLAYSSETELKAGRIWSMKMPGEIIEVQSKNNIEKVHSQGRVLSDRNVLYKYINPNLVAFATYTLDNVHKGILNVILVDVVSGDIKFEVSHKRVAKPIHLVHSENWIVYTFYNDKYRRSELVALELYEGNSQNNSAEFSSLTYPVDPLVERQAYIFPHHVLAMRETITEKGITSKHLLVGLESGGVVEVAWGLLDPRRPLTLTQEAREEGIIPYVPELMLPSEAIITYNNTIPNIAGIYTSPSALESTCLVFIHGLDLFYTRVTPSKTFDMLKEDFDYWLISVVLVALTSAAWLSKRLSSRKALRHSWK